MLLIICACKQKAISPPFIANSANSTNAFIMNGDGFNNTFFKLVSDSNMGYYDTTTHKTTISAYGDSGEYKSIFKLQFSGYTYYPGSKKITSPDTITVLINNLINHNQYLYSSIPDKTTLYVTTYENVNGRIMGAFSGQFVNASNLKDTVNLTNGRFSVARNPDRH
jgi:hypothetical protein